MIRDKIDVMKTKKVKGGKLGLKGSFVITKLKEGTSEVIWRSKRIKNKVVSAAGGYGRNIIMRQLSADTTYPIAITNGKIGTGTTAPADSDTDLQTPVLSTINVASFELTNNVLIINFFIASASLANGTYTEFGLFMGSRLLARSLITPVFVKGTNEDVSIEYSLSLL